jgi:hypothetical protein
VVEFTKAPADGDQVVIRQVLVSKNQDLMIEPGTINRFELVRVNILEIDAPDFRTQRLAAWNDLYAGTLHWRGLYLNSR